MLQIRVMYFKILMHLFCMKTEREKSESFLC